MSLGENLSQYQLALQQEYQDRDKTVSEDHADRLRTKLFELLDDCQTALQQILLTGDTDSSRLAAVKLIFAYTLGDGKVANKEGDLDKILNSLKSPVVK